jgi:hypothetical protein
MDEEGAYGELAAAATLAGSAGNAFTAYGKP